LRCATKLHMYHCCELDALGLQQVSGMKGKAKANLLAELIPRGMCQGFHIFGLAHRRSTTMCVRSPFSHHPVDISLAECLASNTR
jgi:hypothetical protein